jgi:hypothetical protein
MGQGVCQEIFSKFGKKQGRLSPEAGDQGAGSMDSQRPIREKPPALAEDAGQ